MKWIKAFQIDKNIIYEKKNYKKEFKFLQIFFATPHPLFWAYLVITFIPNHWLWKKLYSQEANQLFYLRKKFQKITTEFQPVGTCPKSHLSLEGTMVLYGLNPWLMFPSLISKCPRPFFSFEEFVVNWTKVNILISCINFFEL